MQTQSIGDVFDVIDTAKFLRVSERTVRDLVAKNELPCCRVGNQIRFSKRQLLAHVEGNMAKLVPQSIEIV